jgi:hypothetical protein
LLLLAKLGDIILFSQFLLSLAKNGKTESKKMRISFERTGGFAGISSTKTVDTADIPANEADQLPQLVEASDFFNLPEKITASTAQADRFQYTLTVEDEGRKHTVTVSEAALPGTLRPLIEWLQKR